MMPPKPMTWNDTLFPSIAEAARANNVSEAVMQRRYAQGLTCDDDLKAFPGSECWWEGELYPSYAAAGRAAGNVPGSQMRIWQKRGWTKWSDVKNLRNSKAIRGRPSKQDKDWTEDWKRRAQNRQARERGESRWQIYTEKSKGA